MIRPYLSIDIRYWDTIFTDHHFLLCLFRRQGFRNIVPEKNSIFRFYHILYLYTYFRLLTFCQKVFIDFTLWDITIDIFRSYHFFTQSEFSLLGPIFYRRLPYIYILYYYTSYYFTKVALVQYTLLYTSNTAYSPYTHTHSGKS